jgi:peroxiredoxin
MTVKEEWRTPLQEGDPVPIVAFQARVPVFKSYDPESVDHWDWTTVPSLNLFHNKRVVLFALPGAFTPTCFSAHLPGYINMYDEIKSYAIDEIYCLSVNDAFVMREWGLQMG